MQTPVRRLSHKEYSIGWVCALPKEQTAASAMLDQPEHQELPQPASDTNAYTLGSIAGHNVVIACLPLGKIGNSSSAAVAARMVSTFPAIKICLMVGIAGGVGKDVRLGDVVVSTPWGPYPGVVQWDFGKSVASREADGGFERTGALNNPPTSVLTALTKLQTRHTKFGSSIPQYLAEMVDKFPALAEDYSRSDELVDVLFQPDNLHVEGPDCDDCDKKRVVKRKKRLDDLPRVHYGLIASGNQVVKDATMRNRINKMLGGGVLCLEMEAAGLMNDFPCIVVRGICDYADSHKNKEWQEYAAAVAASFGKEVLTELPVAAVEQEKAIINVCRDILHEVQEINTRITGVAAYQKSEEEEKMLSWLTPIDYAAQQVDNVSRRQAGTCQWLLDDARFKTWQEKPTQTLFCPGDPGVGKSILTSAVIEHLMAKYSSCGESEIGLAYIYFDYKRKEEQKYGDVLASLLKQLAQSKQPFPDQVRALYKLHESRKSRPTPGEIKKTLIAMAVGLSRVFIVLDALDECESSDGRQTTLLKDLSCLQKACGANVFITSRPIQEISAEFEHDVTVNIEVPEADVGKYLDANMYRLPKCVSRMKDPNQKLYDEIKKRILRAVNGVFLLVRLLFESLIDGKPTVYAIRRALRGLPDGSQGTNSSEAAVQAYDLAYADVMERIECAVAAKKSFAVDVLTWVVYSRRPLTSSELRHALAIEPGDTALDPEKLPEIDDILSACAGLVSFDKESDAVRLVHYTAQEYFQRTRKNWLPGGSAQVAEACVAHLSFDAFAEGACASDEEYEKRLEENPFYKYAASNWARHIADAIPGGELGPEVWAFLQNQPMAEASLQAFMTNKNASPWENYSQISPKKITGLHLAACIGETHVVRALLDQPGAKVDEKDDQGRTPLSWAAVYDRRSVVELLLDVGKANAACEDEDGQTPLYLAATYGSLAVVELLLGRHLDGLDLGTKAKAASGSTPLMQAVHYGHLDVVRVFLEKFPPSPPDLRIALLDAIKDGNEETGKVLVDWITTSHGGWGPQDTKDTLLWAAERGEARLTHTLLTLPGAEVDCKDFAGETPLIKAAKWGHIEVLQLLLDSENANPNEVDNAGRTALSWAAGEGRDQVVRCWLDRRFKFDSADQLDRTPLFHASLKNRGQVVKLLLDSGEVGVNTKDAYGTSPLAQADRYGFGDIVGLLQAAGATLDDPTTTPEISKREAGPGLVDALEKARSYRAAMDVQSDDEAGTETDKEEEGEEDEQQEEEEECMKVDGTSPSSDSAVDLGQDAPRLSTEEESKPFSADNLGIGNGREASQDNTPEGHVKTPPSRDDPWVTLFGMHRAVNDSSGCHVQEKGDLEQTSDGQRCVGSEPRASSGSVRAREDESDNDSVASSASSASSDSDGYSEMATTTRLLAELKLVNRG